MENPVLRMSVFWGLHIQTGMVLSIPCASPLKDVEGGKIGQHIWNWIIVKTYKWKAKLTIGSSRLESKLHIDT